jgi:RNA-directed DNA polymerase
MEHAAGVRYYTSGRDAGSAVPGSPVLVRYADDFVVMCTSREQAETVRARLGRWLTPRGLTFSADKTRIVGAEDGFDFLGFHVRRYHGKLLIKPSTAALRRVRERLRTEMRSLRGANAGAVLRTINPIVRGWSAYYRTVVASEVFTALDNYVWTLAYKWAKHSHPNKPKSWVVDRYFGRFNQTRQDRWVFGDRDSGAYLLKFSWTKIVRHQLVRGRASPDDPALAAYWAGRRRKAPTLPLGRTALHLWQTQCGRCPACGDPLLPVEQPQSPSEWERWLRTAGTTTTKVMVASPGGGASGTSRLRLTHSRCRRRHHASDRVQPALLSASEPAGLA